MCVKKMQDALRGKYLWCAMDELTDTTGRAIFCVVTGALEIEKYGDPFVVYVQAMENGVILNILFIKCNI